MKRGSWGNSGFVEALAPESVHRAFEYRLGYYRLEGKWFPSNEVGSRSPSQFRLIEDGTVLRFDRPVEGDTGSRKEKTSFAARQPDAPVLDAPAVEGVEARAWGNQVTVEWRTPPHAPPQLGYALEVFAEDAAAGPRLAAFEDTAPHVHAKRLDTDRPPGSMRLTVTDIFDQRKSITVPVRQAALAPAIEAAGLRPGLGYLYYEAPQDARWERLPDLAALEPARRGCVLALDDTVRQDRDRLYALRYQGYLRAPADGLYVLSIGTCDGSRLSVDGKVVAERDGIHSTSVRQYPIALSRGLHIFEMVYFKGPDAYLADKILVAWEGPGFGLRNLSREDLMARDSGDLPALAIEVAGAVSSGVLEDNLVEVRGRIERHGRRIDKVQLFRGRQLLETGSGTDSGGMDRVAFKVLLPEGDNQIWARLWYDGGSSVESNVLALKAQNRTDEPWKFDVLGEDVFPMGARYREGRMSFAGEGFCFGYRPVTDGGKAWRLITQEIDFDGRGPATIFGEVVSFCPEDPRLVAAGGETSGLFLSTDAGETWKHAGLQGERIACLGFVPVTRQKDGQLVVGTIADSEFATLGSPGRLASPGKAPGRIYAVSLRDGKVRKQVQCELPDFGVTNIAFDVHENFMNFATTRGVYYTWIHGAVFELRLHKMPADVLFTAIGSQPHSDWSAATYAAPFSGTGPSPLHVTTDRSRNWSVVSADARVTGSREEIRLNAGVSCVVRDAGEKDILYLCNRYEILKSTDGGKSYALVYGNARER